MFNLAIGFQVGTGSMFVAWLLVDHGLSIPLAILVGALGGRCIKIKDLADWNFDNTSLIQRLRISLLYPALRLMTLYRRPAALSSLDPRRTASDRHRRQDRTRPRWWPISHCANRALLRTQAPAERTPVRRVLRSSRDEYDPSERPLPKG